MRIERTLATVSPNTLLSIEQHPRMAGAKYFIERCGLRSGPFTSQELKGLAASGEILFSDLIWKQGLLHAIPAYKVVGLFPIAVHETPDAISADADQQADHRFAQGPDSE